MANLFEGLKEGDLEQLVLPFISIDEYESKLDDDSIVVAFFVQDKDPAQDLNRFIQKGPESILDTDVSPAPNEDGYFLVFVEILRDADFPGRIVSILGSLEGLTRIDSWSANIYDVEEPQPVTEELLASMVRLQSMEESIDDDDIVEELSEFFRLSDLDDMVVEGRTVVLEARGAVVELELVDLGYVDRVWENNAVMASATCLTESARANTRRVVNLLGECWYVEQRGENYLAMRRHDGDKVALFRFN